MRLERARGPVCLPAVRLRAKTHCPAVASLEAVAGRWGIAESADSEGSMCFLVVRLIRAARRPAASRGAARGQRAQPARASAVLVIHEVVDRADFFAMQVRKS